MTKLERLRTIAAIPQAFRGPGRVAKSLELVEARAGGGTLEFKATVWKAAKPQLKVETGGKCAYCESPTDTVAHGDVEHYRPKSKYWWLAYCYDNYLYSCQICNEVHKKHFPTHASAGPWSGPTVPAPAPAGALTVLADTLTPDALDLTAGHPFTDFCTTAAKEKAGLVDPYVTDPEPLFKWVADDVLKIVVVAAASTTVASTRAFAAAEKFYGLNREELKRNRWKTYAELVVFKDSLIAFETLGIQPALQQQIRDQIKAMTKVDAPYAGMVRYFVKAFQLTL